jgi:hypothetical protein
MSAFKRTRIAEFKIRASLLLNDLQSPAEGKDRKAAARFQVLPFLKDTSVDDLLRDTAPIRLKHALWVIAMEQGCPSWTALREQVILEDCLFHHASSAFLNHWFNNYDAAKSHQAAHGGYLLRYRKDHVVADTEFIAHIGLGDMQAQWEAIGYDWARPADKDAWCRLYARAKELYLKPPVPVALPDKSKRPAWVTPPVS